MHSFGTSVRYHEMFPFRGQQQANQSVVHSDTWPAVANQARLNCDDVPQKAVLGSEVPPGVLRHCKARKFAELVVYRSGILVAMHGTRLDLLSESQRRNVRRLGWYRLAVDGPE